MIGRYDVCRIKQSGKALALAVVLQHNILDQLRTVVVAPLIFADKMMRINRLHPVLSFNGMDYLVAVDLLVAIERRHIVDVVASADHLADEIKNAIDFVFIGF
jgi:hypothetical protein